MQSITTRLQQELPNVARFPFQPLAFAIRKGANATTNGVKTIVATTANRMNGRARTANNILAILATNSTLQLLLVRDCPAEKSSLWPDMDVWWCWLIRTLSCTESIIYKTKRGASLSAHPAHVIYRKYFVCFVRFTWPDSIMYIYIYYIILTSRCWWMCYLNFLELWTLFCTSQEYCCCNLALTCRSWTSHTSNALLV